MSPLLDETVSCSACTFRILISPLSDAKAMSPWMLLAKIAPDPVVTSARPPLHDVSVTSAAVVATLWIKRHMQQINMDASGGSPTRNKGGGKEANSHGGGVCVCGWGKMC